MALNSTEAGKAVLAGGTPIAIIAAGWPWVIAGAVGGAILATSYHEGDRTPVKVFGEFAMNVTASLLFSHFVAPWAAYGMAMVKADIIVSPEHLLMVVAALVAMRGRAALALLWNAGKAFLERWKPGGNQ